MAPGSYQAAISSSRGERLWQEEIRLAPPFEERTIAIEQLWVEGQIRLGQEPLAAELVFGTRAGSESVRLWSDEEGRFEGVLPRSGRWTVAVSARSPQVATHVQVEVEEASAGGSRRLDILLPATEVRGRVLDPEGRPVAGALVQVLDATGPASNAVRSGEDGSYELRGIAPATIQLQAGASVRGKAMESLPRSLDVAEDRRLTGIDLQLMEREIVQGKVLSSRGPVAGARVSLYPAQGSPGSAQATGADVVTAADGSFATGLPAGSRELEVMVMPPGFALTIRRVVRAPGQPLILAVEELGGTLTLLGSPQEARADGLGALLTLWKDGIPLGEPVLRPWAMLNGGGWDAPSLRLPAMPPGHYQVCWLSGEELARQVLRGYLLTPDPAQCPAGDLAQGGELVLEIPGARS
ncbi:MAG: carboxypeptidase-like regulatory domain-containing protein [Thermoanaerobaculia bacterium]